MSKKFNKKLKMAGLLGTATAATLAVAAAPIAITLKKEHDINEINKRYAQNAASALQIIQSQQAASPKNVYTKPSTTKPVVGPHVKHTRAATSSTTGVPAATTTANNVWNVISGKSNPSILTGAPKKGSAYTKAELLGFLGISSTTVTGFDESLAVINASSLTVSPSAKTLNFNLWYSVDGTNAPTSANKQEKAFTVTWTKTQNQLSAETVNTELNKPAHKTYTATSGTASATYDKTAIFNLLKTSQIAGFDSNLAQVSVHGSNPIASIPVASSTNTLSIDVWYPKDGTTKTSVKSKNYVVPATLTWPLSVDDNVKKTDATNVGTALNSKADPAVISANPPKASYTKAEVMGLLGLSSSWNSKFDSSLVKIDPNSALTTSNTDKSLTVNVWYPKNGKPLVGINTDKYIKSFTITWSETRNEKTARTQATSVNTDLTSHASTYATQTGSPKNTYSATQALALINAASISNVKSNLLKVVQTGTSTAATSLTVANDAKTLSFDVWYPKDGITASSVKADNYVVPVSMTWAKTRDARDIAAWFGTGAVTIPKITGSAPATLTVADIKTWFTTHRGNSKTKPTGTSDITVTALSSVSGTGPFNLETDKKTFTFRVSVPNDGHTSSTMLTRDVTVSYDSSKNTLDASTWFNAITTTTPASSALPTITGHALTISEASALLNLGTKPASLTASLAFDGTAPTITGGTSDVVFTLKFPTNGVSGSQFLTKTFTIHYTQSNAHKEAKEWLNGITAKTLSSLTVPSNLYGSPLTKAMVTPLLNVPTKPTNVSANWELISHPSVSYSDKTFSFDISIAEDGIDKSKGTITKKIDITYGKSLAEDAAATWFANLALKSTANIAGPAPKTPLTIDQIKNMFNIGTIGAGLDASTLVFGATSPTVPAANANSITFTLKYPTDGVSTSNYLADRTFTITYAETQNEHDSKGWINPSAGDLAIAKTGTPPASYTHDDLLAMLTASGALGAKPTSLSASPVFTYNSQVVGTTAVPLLAANKVHTYTVTFPANGVSGTMLSRNMVLTWPKSINEINAKNFVDGLPSTVDITGKPSHEGAVTITDVETWLTTSVFTPGHSLSASLTIPNPPTIDKTTYSLNLNLKFPANGVSGPLLSKPVTINFGKTITEVETKTWWDGITWADAQTLSVTDAPTSISLSEIKTALNLPAGPYTNAMYMTEQGQTTRITSWNLLGSTNSKTFTIHSPKNIHGSSAEYTQDVTFTWTNTIDQQGVTAWVNNLHATHTETTPPPATITKTDILNWIGASSNPVLGRGSTVATPILKFSGSAVPSAGHATTDNEKVFDFTLTYFTNGVSGATQDFDFKVTYADTRNEKKARDWFNTLTSTKTVHAKPPHTGAITASDVQGWLTSTAKPTSTISGFTFSDLVFDGTAPSIDDMTSSLNFKLKYPVNGKDATDGWLPSKSFTVTFDKTIKEVNTKAWFDNLDWTGAKTTLEAISPTPAKITLNEIKDALGMATTPNAEFANMHVKVGGVTKEPYILNGATDTVVFNIEVLTHAPSGSPVGLTQSHTLTVNFNPTLDEQAVTNWLAKLKTSSTPTSPDNTAVIAVNPSATASTHPPFELSLTDLQGFAGLAANPKPTLGPGSTPGKVSIYHGTQLIDAAHPYNPSTSDKTIDFKVVYYVNGVSGTTSEHAFNVVYGQSQDDYFNALVGPIPAYEKTTPASHTDQTFVTPTTGSFGILTSHIDATGVPKTLAELKAISGGAFTTSVNGLNVEVASVVNVERDSANPTGYLSRSKITLKLTYQGLSLNKNVYIDYTKADIQPIIKPTEIQAKLNAIISDSTTNTHNGKILIPVDTINYLKDHKLGFILHVDSVKAHDINVMNLTIPATGNLEVAVPSGVLSNNSSHNQINISVSLPFDTAKFTDPSHSVHTQETAFAKTLSYDVWIDTSSAEIWGTSSSTTGIEIAGSTTENWSVVSHNVPTTSHYKMEVQQTTSYNTGAWTAASNYYETSMWDQTIVSGATMGDYKLSLEARLVAATDSLPGGTHYVLSSDRQTPMPNSVRDRLKKVINLVPPSRNQANNILGEVKSDLVSGLASAVNTHNINWGSTQSTIDALMTKNHMSIQYSLDGTTWTSNIPNEFKHVVADRHLHIKVTADSGFQFNGRSQYDLASIVQRLIGWIDKTKLTSGTNPGLITTHTITGTTDTPTINLDTLRPGLKYEYSSDNGSTWVDEATFKTEIKNIWTVKSNYKYRVIVTDSSLYELSGTVVDNFDVTGLNTYIDVATLITDAKTISAKGKFGVGEEIFITLPSTLEAMELAKSRVKLQFKITGASAGNIDKWTDVPVQTGSGTAKKVVLASDVIPGNADPELLFRLVPYVVDATTAPTSLPARNIEGGSEWTHAQYTTHSGAVLSNTAILTAYRNPIKLPTIVSVGALSATNAKFTATGTMHTKNTVLTETVSAHDNIVAANSGISTAPTYWNNIKIVYTISDGTGSKMYGFTANEFQKWLHGDYATATLPKVWQVESATGQAFDQIEMKQVTLPAAHRTPNWNELDMSSIKQRWATTTTKDQNPTKLYAASGNNAPVSVSNFASVLKWWDATATFDVVKSVYITGNTHVYDIDETNLISRPLNSNSNFITNTYLNTYGLKRQFSLDGTTWTDTKPDYDSQTWALKVNRDLFMRVVPISGAGTDPFVGTTMYVHNPTGEVKASFVTTKKDSTNNREFKTYVVANVSDFSSVEITGTQYKLFKTGSTNEADGVNEAVDTDVDEYSTVELEYLYNGNWLNKAALISAIQANRQPASGQDKSSLTFPADFANGIIKTRWHLTASDKEYVLSSAAHADAVHSTSGDITSDKLRDFSNIWNFQSETIKTMGSASFEYTDPKRNKETPDPQHPGETILTTPDYVLSGSLNSATLKLSPGTVFTPQYITTNHLKIQYSTVQFPSSDITSNDWVDATKANSGTEIFDGVAINNQHKSLWIRVVVDGSQTGWEKLSVSSYKDGGNSNTVLPIKIDATRMKFEITTDSTQLTDLVVEGNTQALTSTDPTHGVAKYLDGTSTAIDYQKQVAGTAGLVTITDAVEKATWVATNGITIRWQVTQSRQTVQTINGNTIQPGDVVEFDRFADLQAAVSSGALNFDSSSLKVQWGILPAQQRNNSVKDSAWVHPTSADAIVNKIFTTDYLTLTSTSVDLTGNTVATTATVDATIASKIPTGIKIQYSEDGTTWTDAFDGRIDGNKDLWIKLAPTGALYDLKAASHDQKIKIDATKVYTAIILKQDASTEAADKAAWVAYLQTLQVGGLSTLTDEGFTAEGQFGIYSGAIGSEAKAMPTIPNAQDGTTKGHWEYTTEQTISPSTTWATTIEGAMEDYYGSGTKAFDKDKIDHFTARFVLDASEKTLAANAAGYMFVDANGNEIDDASMSADVDVTGLTQYLYIDNQDPNIPELTAGSGVHMSWRELANQGKFLPGFNSAASGIARYADYTGMQYEGNALANGHSVYKFDENPYTSTVDLTRTDDNALAPRHAHFEYSTKDSSGSAWSAWTTVAPTDRPIESNSNYFRIRIAADAGYAIPNIASIFGGADQNWEKDYPVVIIKNTENLTPGNIEFVGFDIQAHPDARIKTDDANGDFTKGNPLFNLLKNGVDWTELQNPDAFVVEYNVYNGGNPISWTDTSGISAVGWHSRKLAPGPLEKWFGSMPVSLKNGDVVHIRLRAKTGYKISDSASLDDQTTGLVDFSSEIVFPQITSLIRGLSIPTGFAIYDTKYHTDLNGNPINPVATMPSITFGGSEGAGTITMTTGHIAGLSQYIDFEVQVLRPIDSAGQLFDGHMKPITGLKMLDDKGVEITSGPNNGRIYNPTTNKWVSGIDNIANSWVDPTTVNYLRVGDLVRVRVKAKPGSGFKWEDETTSFIDIDTTPKTRTHYAYNTGGALGGSSDKYLDVTPLPVTDLLVKPALVPSDISLVYSLDPAWIINGHEKIVLSDKQKATDKWMVQIQTKKLGGSASFGSKLSTIPTNLKNGDQVKISIDLKSGYKFDPSYIPTNQPTILTVSGLKYAIDMANTKRPILHFAGRQGSGTVDAIAEDTVITNNNHWSSTLDSNGFKTPKLPTSGYTGNGIKWQYQYADFDPSSAGPSQIKLLQWTDTPPTNLQVGWFVRMRIAPVDPTDIVLGKDSSNNIETIYSWTGGDDSVDDVAVEDYKRGWTKVTGLKIDAQKIDLDLKVGGFIGKTTVGSKFSIFDPGTTDRTLEESSVIVEYSVDGTTWTVSVSTPDFQTLTNGDHIWMRVKAKTGMTFDSTSLTPGGYRVDADGALRKTEWDNIEITGLQKYLNVDGVTLDKPDAQLGLGNYVPMGGSGSALISGKVKLVDPVFNNIDSTADLSGSLTDPNNGNVAYSSYLQVQYTIERMNIDSGQTSAPFTTTTIPTNLKNGDRISVKVISTNPDFKLSKTLSTSITVSGLQQIIQEPEAPQFVFVGQDGKGTAFISNGAPAGFKWEYISHAKGMPQTPPASQEWTGHSYIEAADGTVKEVIKTEIVRGGTKVTVIKDKTTGLEVDMTALPAGSKFVEIPDLAPKTLSNGDEIEVRLVSILDRTVARAKDKTDPTKSHEIISQWKTVSGLETVIDLSSLRLKIFDTASPYKPDQDISKHDWTYAFKLNGHQEGSSIVEIAATLSGGQGSPQLLDTQGNPVPNADKLTWEFAQDKSNAITENTVWSKAVPQGLENGQYIHARLTIRNDVTGTYTVKNFAPLTYKVPKLDPPEELDSQILEYIGIGLAGVISLALVAGGIYYARTRKKFNYKGKPKMN